jgi:DNA-binding NarL/FixJ family response regulator
VISVIIADDHTMVRRGLRSLLATDAEIAVLGEAGDGYEALRLIQQHRPAVALVDVSMPGMSGVDVARAARDAGLETAVLILSMHTGPAVVREALAAGARGYLLKDQADDLLRAIRQVAGGARVLGAGVYEAQNDGERDALESLTNRERQTVTLIASGLTNRAIAGRLGISTRTVEAYRASAMRKLGIRSAAELTMYALERGLLRH